MRRFVLPEGAIPQLGQPLNLPDDIARHLHVLRLEPGAHIALTDGGGVVCAAIIEKVAKKAAVVRVAERRQLPPPAGPEITLLQGVGKGEKLDQVARQVGELGAQRLVPVLSARAVAKRDGKVDRLRTIADDALRVAGGAWRMRIDEPCPLEHALRIEADVKLTFMLGATQSFKRALAEAQGADRVALLVGPEGGFSAEEQDQAEAAGFRSVHLGDRVLRTETAGPAVVAMARFALEDG